MYLIFNAGSSSIKFKLINIQSFEVLISGTLKNYEEGKYKYESNNEEIEISEKDYNYSVEFIFEKLGKDLEIEKVVHRIVHGGEEFKEPIELSSENIERIKKYNEYAPLHNPFALSIIEQVKKLNPALIQFAVFDTSFHLTNKKEDFLYGLPYGYYENIKVRRFGFHGIAHKYITNEIKTEKHISVHLGSGSSVCAILNGESIDHSFGFTPNENLIMTTRVGEIDYDAVLYVKKKLNLSDEEIEKLINKESGFLGISGYTKDMKTLVDDYSTNERAKLTIDMYVNGIVKYISYFFVKMEGCDVLTFSGGIGAGSDLIRKLICKKLEILGIKIDDSKNDGKIDVTSKLDISDENSKTKVWIIPVDEEIEMVREVTYLQF